MFRQSPCPVVKVMFPTHEPPHTHHLVHRHSQKTATPFSDFGLTHAPARSLGVVRTYSIVGQCRRTAATATNKQFCVIAALPSLENFITFARWLLVGNCVRAATTQSCRALAATQKVHS